MALDGSGGHATQMELAKAVPCRSYVPREHTGVVIGMHCPLPLLSLYLPWPHPLHLPSTISKPGLHRHAGLPLLKHLAASYTHA